MSRLVVYEHINSGHRPAYLEFYRKALSAETILGNFWQNLTRLLFEKHVFFSTCDDYFLRFFMASLIRALLGRRTLGLTIRTEATLNSNAAKHRLKRVLLRVLRMFSMVKVVSILPHWIEPKLKEFTDDWVLDPQFYDIPVLFPHIESTEYSSTLKKRLLDEAGERPIVLALGKFSRAKGISFMIKLYCSISQLRRRFLFAIVGTNVDLPDQCVNLFIKAGGVVIDTGLSDTEFLDLYNVADLVWCCYAPYYNQSSGIFGRAIQLGKATIVRKGSYLDLLQLGYRCSIEYGNIGWRTVQEFLSFRKESVAYNYEKDGIDRFKSLLNWDPD